MTRWVCLAALLLALGCRDVRPCTNDTLYLDIQSSTAIATADALEISVQSANRTYRSSVIYSGGSGGLELSFDGGYPTGTVVVVSVVARRAGQPIASASVQGTLSAGCTRLPIVLESDGADAAVDSGDVPDGSTGAPRLSCAGLEHACLNGTDCCASSVIEGGTFKRYDVTTSPATVSSFQMDRYEITVGRFRKFWQAGQGTQQAPPAEGAGAHPKVPGSGWQSVWNSQLAASSSQLSTALFCNAESKWSEAAGASDTSPVSCITWFEAFAFCAWDGARLATEVEWDYAAEGGAEQRFYVWSNPPTDQTIDDTYAVYSPGASQKVSPVGSRSPKGDSKWNVSDLLGNVAEWVLDYKTTAVIKPCVDCANVTSGTDRVRRGGAFTYPATSLPLHNGSAGLGPSNRGHDQGARCVRDL